MLYIDYGTVKMTMPYCQYNCTVIRLLAVENVFVLDGAFSSHKGLEAIITSV